MEMRGAISGLRGASAYDSRRGTEGEATERLNILAAGHVAVSVLMFAGALIYTFVRPRRGKQ